MNKRHYEHTLPNIRGSLSNTYLALIPAWNDALRQWKKACNEQIVIRQSTL